MRQEIISVKSFLDKVKVVSSKNLKLLTLRHPDLAARRRSNGDGRSGNKQTNAYLLADTDWRIASHFDQFEPRSSRVELKSEN